MRQGLSQVLIFLMLTWNRQNKNKCRHEMVQGYQRSYTEKDTLAKSLKMSTIACSCDGPGAQ